MEERDIVIIGGGPAGYSAAIKVSQLGGRLHSLSKILLEALASIVVVSPQGL